MPLKREIYYVVHDKRADAWKIEKKGASRMITVAETKAEAITIARKLANAAELAHVIVHRLDGSIETEYTYGDDRHDVSD